MPQQRSRRVLALIPARGGSRGLPGKNIRPLAGKPLLAWTIEAALAAQAPDRVVLSSDDEGIMAVARAHGCEVPFVRPAALAGDTCGSLDVVLHAAHQEEAHPEEVHLEAVLCVAERHPEAGHRDRRPRLLWASGVNSRTRTTSQRMAR